MGRWGSAGPRLEPGSRAELQAAWANVNLGTVNGKNGLSRLSQGRIWVMLWGGLRGHTSYEERGSSLIECRLHEILLRYPGSSVVQCKYLKSSGAVFLPSTMTAMEGNTISSTKSRPALPPKSYLWSLFKSLRSGMLTSQRLFSISRSDSCSTVMLRRPGCHIIQKGLRIMLSHARLL